MEERSAETYPMRVLDGMPREKAEKMVRYPNDVLELAETRGSDVNGA
jgi:hypothetical protein